MPYVTKTCEVNLTDFVNMDHEQFLDHISEQSHGSTLLMDFSWKAVHLDVQNQTVTLEVCGDRSLIDEPEATAVPV